jgi:PPK2 family polyphosphate:nucleotide phosphotransferase
MRDDVRESRPDEWTSDEELQVAKPGGKTDSKRAAKGAGNDKALTKSGKPKSKGKAGKAAKPLKAAKAAKAPKGAKPPKVAKPKRLKGAEQLVEKVAAQIVAAELDRVLEENRLEAENGGSRQAAEPAEAGEAVEAVEVAVVEGALGEGAEAPATTEAVEPGHAAEPVQADPAHTGHEPAHTDHEPAPSAKPSARRPLHELLRVPAGPVDLADYDPSHTPGVASRAEAEARMPGLLARLDELQERLFAAARGGDGKRRILLVLQGMDTSGKGGTVRHVIGRLDPNGVRLTAFKAPTEEERAHDFLWRIRAALPGPGEVGIFDRSHYEDVLIGRVRKLALPMVIGRRYILINKFEQGLVDDGCVVVKCFLHIGPDEQRDRLLARLDDPAKHWKYNPGDVDDRKLWPEYQDAYRIALEKTSTDAAPWHVIPANRKWYRNYAITRLLVEALEGIDPQYPAGDFDATVERERVLAS